MASTSLVKTICCLVYIFVGIVIAAPASKLPKHFKQCQLSDPAFNECLKNGLQSAVPHLAKGVQSLGLLPMDPLRITALTIDRGAGAVKFVQNFKNLDIKNLHSSIIDKLEFNKKDYIIDVAMHVQKPLTLEGIYDANGKLLVLPISGNGTCKFVLDDFKATAIAYFKPITKNGNTYLEFKKLTWKFTTSKMHLRLNNLFNGDKALGENMNVFLNENWKELLTEMQPAFEEALSTAFIGIAQQFFSRISLNQMFKN